MILPVPGVSKQIGMVSSPGCVIVIVNVRLQVSDEFRIFSQHGEDGVLDRIASSLSDRMDFTFVELGADPFEGNTLALRARGWEGVMFDERAGEGIIAARLTSENINAVLAQHMSPSPCGVLSVDLDGNDYWIVDAITYVAPAVIVVEYNAAFDAEIKVATPYQEPRRWGGGCDYGASLNAWASLLSRKWGGRLCYVESSASNAFFVRESLAVGRLDLSRSAADLMPKPVYSYGDPYQWEWVSVD